MREQPGNGRPFDSTQDLRRIRRGKRMLWASLLFLGISLLTLLASGVLFSQGCNLAFF
jgi:hypothetical protein